MKSISGKNKEARSALSMSQETLAEKVGASRRSIIAYEKETSIHGPDAVSAGKGAARFHPLSER